MREHQALYRKYFLLKCKEGELIVVKQILKWLLKTLYMHGKWNAVNSKFNTYTYLETLASQVVEKQHALVCILSTKQSHPLQISMISVAQSLCQL